MSLTITGPTRSITINVRPPGPTDHGILAGLADDDHPQYALRAATRTIHEPIAGPSRSTSAPGQGPTVTAFGTLIALVFTPNDTADRAFRTFKIPSNYVGTPSFHIHWTKSTNADQTARNVRWRIAYSVFNGHGEVGNVAETSAEVEDTYDATDTTDRAVYRTTDIAAVGFVAGYYVSMYVEAITPNGTALSADPALVSLDLTYLGTINLGA